MNFIDLTGKHFGYLTVLKKCEYSKTAHTYLWECQCKCGNITKVSGNNLKNGHTISCGCKKGKTIHNKHNTRLYRIYHNMKQRCNNPKNIWFKNYEPNNCRWCNEKQQQNNMRKNKLITYKNETHTVAEWERILNKPCNFLRSRLRSNTFENILQKSNIIF